MSINKKVYGICLLQTDAFTFTQEDVTGIADQARYYIETDGDKYYLMVTSHGDVTALHADDLEIGSLNDLHSRFRHVYG